MEQPKWCNYPHAASPTFLGCWSLLGGLVKDENYCKDCDCYKRLKKSNMKTIEEKARAYDEAVHHKKVLFADLDGTLIDTIFGNTFPKGIWDMQFKWDVLSAIKEYGFEILIIVSNQGGIEKGFVDERHFCKGKMNYIQFALMEYLGIPVEYDYCKSNDKDSQFRKPNTGMLEHVCYKNLPKHNIIVSKDEMLMIGDASGKKGQFSDSDKKTAENFGIDYLDIEDFKQYVEINKCNTQL